MIKEEVPHTQRNAEFKYGRASPIEEIHNRKHENKNGEKDKKIRNTESRKTNESTVNNEMTNNSKTMQINKLKNAAAKTKELVERVIKRIEWNRNTKRECICPFHFIALLCNLSLPFSIGLDSVRCDYRFHLYINLLTSDLPFSQTINR